MKTNPTLPTMKCGCGLEHRIEIIDWKLDDYERDDFITNFPWALTESKEPRFESMFATSMGVEHAYLMLIVGSFEGEEVAYAVINPSEAVIFYAERKEETDPKRYGFHKAIMEHLINGTLRDKDIEATAPTSRRAETFLRRFCFAPKDVSKPNDRWIRRRKPTNE